MNDLRLSTRLQAGDVLRIRVAHPERVSLPPGWTRDEQDPHVYWRVITDASEAGTVVALREGGQRA